MPNLALSRAFRSMLALSMLSPVMVEAQQAPVVADSEGIRVVSNALPPSGPTEWVLSSEPRLRIGTAEADADSGDQVLSRVAGALRLSNGDIVVANAGGYDLRYYTDLGATRAIVGGKGGGPGEFQALSWIGNCGADSVLAYDFLNRRVSVFGPDHELVRSFTPTSPGSPTPPAALHCDREGHFVVLGRSPSIGIDRTPYFRPDVALAIATTTGDLTASLGFVPGTEQYRRPNSVGPRALGKRTSVAIGGGRVYVGTADTYAVAAFDLQGRHVMTVRLDTEPEPITDEDLSAFRTWELAQAHRASQRASWARQLDEMVFPEYFPAYASLLVDAVGCLWVEDYEMLPATPRTWTVFSPNGALLARVRLPAGFGITDVGSDWVLGVGRDGLGVEYVELYSLVR